MLPDPNATPLSDADLLALGRHYFQAADGEGASEAALLTLRDFVPALLHRLQERAAERRDTVSLRMFDLSQPGAWEALNGAADEANAA